MKLKSLKALAVVTIAAGAVAHAQQKGSAEQLGKDDYNAHCAVCHGADGTGNGSYAPLQNATIPDLTTLSARNGGVFPSSRVYETIDGRLEIAAHGTRAMPIWGQMLTYKSHPLNRNPEAFVRAKINGVVMYIHRLQAN